MSRATKPEKICVSCERPFQWRKKWRRCWDQVRYCSERCRRSGPSGGRADLEVKS